MRRKKILIFVNLSDCHTSVGIYQIKKKKIAIRVFVHTEICKSILKKTNVFQFGCLNFGDK